MAIGTAAALLGAAAIGAGSSIISGNKAASAQSSAASQAAAASERATQAQIAEARRQYNQTRTDYAPYRTVGYGALGKLAGLYGIGSGTSIGGEDDWSAYLQNNPDVLAGYNSLSPADRAQFPTAQDYAQYHYQTYGQGEGRAAPTTGASTIPTREEALSDFTTSPQYSFVRDQGLQAIDRQNAARGLLNSGGADKARMRYASGLASGEYDSYANRLASLAGVGQSATGSTAAAGQNASNTVTGALGANASNQASAIQAAGNARASSYANIGSSINNGVNNLASLYLYQQGGGFNPPTAKTGTWV